jgi:hypothetical protein
MSLMQINHTMYFINNHFSFLVKYTKVPHTDLARIVAFEVTPCRFSLFIPESASSLWISGMIHAVIFHFPGA